MTKTKIIKMFSSYAIIHRCSICGNKAEWDENKWSWCREPPKWYNMFHVGVIKMCSKECQEKYNKQKLKELKQNYNIEDKK